MKKWLYKSLVVSVALLTFGVITPKHEIWTTLDQEPIGQTTYIPSKNEISSALQLDSFIIEESHKPTIETFKVAAKEQAYLKFGTRVGPVIENEFEANIFPKMEEAIALTFDRLGYDKVRNLTISEKPSGHYAEKIFHIVDNDSLKDVIRFHVRTENRPFDGYYYNFHYHTVEDNYAAHYTLGEIYWSKNMPPKWLS